jgi:predicted nuclease of predicted toxin-antitoxin system
VRFLLDHDVDAAVGQMLRRAGHDCWRAGEIGLATATDDALTVWAIEHEAVLVSTDREFGQRKMRKAVGHHLWLVCRDWEASELLYARLDDLLSRLNGRAAITVRVSKDKVVDSSAWD